MGAARSASLHEVNDATFSFRLNWRKNALATARRRRPDAQIRSSRNVITSALPSQFDRRPLIPPSTLVSREPMQPPPQIVQWLKQRYPKPIVDEVRVSVSTFRSMRVDRLSSNLVSTGFRNATTG
jgi:hypothetical protein